MSAKSADHPTNSQRRSDSGMLSGCNLLHKIPSLNGKGGQKYQSILRQGEQNAGMVISKYFWTYVNVGDILQICLWNIPPRCPLEVCYVHKITLDGTAKIRITSFLTALAMTPQKRQVKCTKYLQEILNLWRYFNLQRLFA